MIIISFTKQIWFNGYI